jgi:hypothetical protein
MGFHRKPTGVDISDADAIVTDVKIAKTFYSVAAPRKTGTMDFDATEILKNGNDSEATIAVMDVYTKEKETKLDEAFIGDIRIKFDMRCGAAAETVFAKIYRNGVAIGTQCSTNLITYTTYSEDFSSINWAVGDLIQIYAYRSGVGGYLQNFRFYYELDATPIAVTNQDP